MKFLLTFSLFLLVCAFGNTQPENGTNSRGATSALNEADFQAKVIALIKNGKYFEGTWFVKASSLRSGAKILKIKFLDLNKYEVSVEDKNYPKSWTGDWTWSSSENLMILRNFQGGESWKLKVTSINLASFETNEGAHFTKYFSDNYNVTPSQNTNAPIVSSTISLEKDKIIGTWRVVVKETWSSHEYNFSIYPDGRMFMIASQLPQPCNGSWKINGELFIPFWDDYSTLGTFQTVSFNGNIWVFNDSYTGKKLTAQKLSNIPIPIVQSDGYGNKKNPQKPQSSIINSSQLLGTWKALSSTGITFFYTIYSDQRLYHCYGYNAYWTVNGDMFYNYWDNKDHPSICKVISFSSANWVYEGVGDGIRYTATKISDVPIQNITSNCKQPTESNCANCGQSLNKCRCQSRCVCCKGKGKQDCGSCNGNGSREIGEYDGNGNYRVNNISCGSCYNGKTTCWCCKGTGKQ